MCNSLMMTLYHVTKNIFTILKVSLVSKDSSMLDGLDNASIEMEEAKVPFYPLLKCSRP